MSKKKTLSKTSPKGGSRACLCDDGTYKKKCCEGALINQGIGNTNNGSTHNVVNVDTTRNINN